MRSQRCNPCWAAFSSFEKEYFYIQWFVFSAHQAVTLCNNEAEKGVWTCMAGLLASSFHWFPYCVKLFFTQVQLHQIWTHPNVSLSISVHFDLSINLLDNEQFPRGVARWKRVLNSFICFFHPTVWSLLRRCRIERNNRKCWNHWQNECRSSTAEPV